MAAPAGVVAMLYYARSPRGLGSTEDIRKEACDASPLLPVPCARAWLDFAASLQQ